MRMKRFISIALSLLILFCISTSLASSTDEERSFVLEVINANRRSMILRHFPEYTIYLYNVNGEENELYQICYNSIEGQINADYTSPFAWVADLYDDAMSEIGYYPDTDQIVVTVNATGEKLDGGFFNLFDVGEILENLVNVKEQDGEMVILSKLSESQGEYYYGDLVKGCVVETEFTINKEDLLLRKLDIFSIDANGQRKCIETDIIEYGASDKKIDAYKEVFQDYKKTIDADVSTREVTVYLTDDDGNIREYNQKVLKNVQIHVEIPDNYRLYTDDQYITAYTTYAGGATKDLTLYGATEKALSKTRNANSEKKIQSGIDSYKKGNYEDAYHALDSVDCLRDDELTILGLAAYNIGDYKYAVSRFFDAAAQGNVEAQFYLGYCCYYGIGTEISDDDAYYWFDLAAEAENNMAQYYAGICYRDGVGTKTNNEAAFYYFEKAALQEHQDAQFELAKCYENGIGVEKNIDESIYWYTKAANAGHFNSQSYLADYYESSNKQESIYWTLRTIGIDDNFTKHSAEELTELIADAQEAINRDHTFEQQSWSQAFATLEQCINEKLSGTIGNELDAQFIKDWDMYTIWTTAEYKNRKGENITSEVQAELTKNNGNYEVYYMVLDGNEEIINRYQAETAYYWETKPEAIPNISFNLDLSTFTHVELLTIIDCANKQLALMASTPTIDDSDQTGDTAESIYYLSNTETVNAGNEGYHDSKEILAKDLHFGWNLGKFYVTGFSAMDFEPDGTPVFIKATGDDIKLYYKLEQDINKLNNNSGLSISEDKDGYDYEFEPQKSNMGRGTLFVRHTDYQGKQKIVSYTNYLSAWNHGANTSVINYEEGDYSLAFDYEIRSKSFIGDIVDWLDSYTNYRCRFDFKVRNGNANAFVFDCENGQELKNNTYTPNGFVINFARSRYLKINVVHEKVDISGTMVKKTVVTNDVAYDQDEFTKEGLYTILIGNRTALKPTVKVIYIGFDPEIVNYVTSGQAYDDAIRGL